MNEKSFCCFPRIFFDYNTSEKEGISVEDPEKKRIISPFLSLRRGSTRRDKRSCPLSEIDDHLICYKNPAMLIKFVTEGGKIINSRYSGVSKRKQMLLKRAVRRCRFLGLLPCC